MRKTMLAAGILTATLLAGCVKETSFPSTTESTITLANPTAEEALNDYVADEVLIKFKNGASPTGINNALVRISGKVKEHVLTNAMQQSGDNEGFYVVQVPTGVMIAIDKIKDLADVEYAEPNYILRHIPIVPLDDANDPYYGLTNPNERLWGMMGELTTPVPGNKYGSRAGEVWSGASGKDASGTILYGETKQTGSGNVYVAVIDEGIDYNHPDLKANIWTNTGEIAGNKIDDDKDGKVDDLHGYDFYNNDGDVYDTGADDHGTHVAGTIGAVGGNGIGVAGVCWNISIISAKFLGPNGGSTDAAVKALDYITNLRTLKKLNIVATNNSWGGGSKSTTLQSAITRSENAGILFVAAAGNNGTNTDKRLSYPSCYPNNNIISVASISLDGSKSSFSNYGATTVDIGAPGSYIWSTTPANTYSKYSGTSMATPHVTGAVALYAAAKGLTPLTPTDAQALKNAILNSARPTVSLQRKCVTGGRLDVHRAINNDYSPLPAD